VRAQTGNQAALVVVHGDGRIVTRCVEFSEPQINGYEVLQRSGLDLNIEVSGMGAAICRIDGEGCTYPRESCFCQTEGETYTYWSYWRLGEAGWSYSQLGTSNAQVNPGAVEGWVWGAGTVNSAPSPPALTFAEICAPATATPPATSTALPTATETPSPTTVIPATLTATFTALPTPTLSPTPVAPPPSATWTPVPTATATDTATPVLPRIELFAVDRPTIEAGQPARISWMVREAAQVVLQGNGADQVLGGVGNLEVRPHQTTTYVLVARNPAGEVSATVTVTVNPAATIATATRPAAPLPVATETATATVVELAAPPPTATPVPTVTPLPTDTPPSPTVTAVPMLSATVEATATAPVIAPAVSATPTQGAPVVMATVVWSTATPNPAQAQLQLVMIFGGVALVLLIPMGLLGVAALFWMIRNRE
jgi:hypothetical protein